MDEYQPAYTRPSGYPLTGTERGISYPSPFFDVSSTYLPRSIKALFQWCKFYFWTNPLISAICTKLSEYPITDIILESRDSNVRERWEWLLMDRLQFRLFEIGTALDYHVFGNSYSSVSFPFRKMLVCDGCGATIDAENHRRRWRYTGDRFLLRCPECGHQGRARAQDRYIRSASEVRLIRWDPSDIDPKYQEQTGRVTYNYTPPPHLRADVMSGKKDVVLSTPQEVLEAIKLNRPVRLNDQNVYHMRRTTIAHTERGLGVPVIFPVLKDTFYLQVLKKAQEALSLGTIVPLRIFFPQAGGPMQDPITSVNLTDWRNQLESELRRWRFDPLYTPILPFPVGHQLVGGEGRALLLSQEVRVWSEQIIIGMGYPPSLVFGDVTWQGSNVALRMLENSFLRYMELRKRQIDHVLRNLSTFLEWDPPSYHLKPFKMADDMARTTRSMTLNQWGKLSDRTMMGECDYEYDREKELTSEEQASRLEVSTKQAKAAAEAQGEAMIVQAAYSARAQIETQRVMQAEQMAPGSVVPGSVGGPQGGDTQPGYAFSDVRQPGMDARVVPKKLAEHLQTLTPESRQLHLQQLQAQYPETYHQVMSILSPVPQNQALPEVLPPRRGAGSALI